MEEGARFRLGSESEASWERAVAPRNVEPSVIGRMVASWNPEAEIVTVEPISKGGRNTLFSLTLRRAACDRVVLRIYADDDGTYRKEAALHRHLQGLVPLPRCLCATCDEAVFASPFAILEFLPGTLLSEESGGLGMATLFEELGEAAARIHQRAYPAIGFLDEHLELAERLSPLAEWYEDFLGARATQRLGPDLTRQLRKYLQDSRALMDTLDSRPTLVHGDFRPANLLVAGGKLTGVLDWEFAMAGHPGSDLGQLFRYDDCWPAAFEQAFVSGYRREGGSLDPDWRNTARLRDLANLLQMLDRPSDAPHFYASTRRRIAIAISLRPKDA